MLRRVLLIAGCLLITLPATAGMMMRGMGKAPSSGYTPLCGGANPSCAYAYSTERQMASTATTALQVYRSVDGTTQKRRLYQRRARQHRGR